MKKKYKIAMLLNNDLLLPEVIDPRVYKEAKSLVKDGYDVFVVCRNSIKDKTKIEEFEGIKVYRIPQRFVNIPFFGFVLGPLYKKIKTILEIKKINPDIIHAHELNILQIGVLAKFLVKKPLIYDAHEDYVRYVRGRLKVEVKQLSGKERIRKKLHYFIQIVRRSFGEYFYVKFFVDRVITVNKFLWDKYSRLTYTQIVMNCRSLSDLPKDPEEEVLSRFGISKYSFKVAFVTKFYKNWGFETVFEASKILPNDVQIILVCPLTQGLKELKKKYEPLPNIKFTDAVSREDVMRLVVSSEVGIIPLPYDSNTEISTPNKLFEYMLGGIPVISSDFSLIREILEKEKCGLLVKPESVEELVNAIIFLKNNSEERKRMGENARKAVFEKYNWEAQEKELLKVYEEFLES